MTMLLLFPHYAAPRHCRMHKRNGVGCCTRLFLLLSLELLLLSTRRGATGFTSIFVPTTFTSTAFMRRRGTVRLGGGRASETPDQIEQQPQQLQQDTINDGSPAYVPRVSAPSEARLIVIQVTDVYTLEHFASLKNLIKEVRAGSGASASSEDSDSTGCRVVCILTGDFLSPYLLSSVDRGAGMMHAIIETPIDYLTWGNHEADIDHRTVCRHVRDFAANGGIWINSNMLDHEAMDAQREYDIITIRSADGTQQRKVGLVAVLSDDPALYQHFKAPGAFGGATITDPWAALTKYKAMLESDPYNCDLIIPLQHTYVPDDHKTCREFDFPVIMSGHDHHRVDQVVEGTRLLKPGMNAVYATILEISWPNQDQHQQPTITSQFVRCQDYEPDPILAEVNERAYDALEPLRNTELARVPRTFEPLTSANSRGSVCTMGQYIASLLKSSLNLSLRQRQHAVEAVLLMGGNIRGNAEYPPRSFFSLEALEAEVKDDEVIAVIPMPGWLLSDGVVATHEKGQPSPGYMQYDIGVRENDEEVTHVNGEPIDRDRVYRVATKISDLTNGQSPPWTEYYKAHPEVLPPKGAYVNIQAEIMSYCARNLWRKIWEAISVQIDDENCEGTAGDQEDDECHAEERLETMDGDGDGTVTVREIHAALRDMLGYSVDEREMSLAEFVHSFADLDNDGQVSLHDFEMFCQELSDTYQRDQWRLDSPRQPI